MTAVFDSSTGIVDPLREALEEIVGLTTYLRQGGPDPMDLQGLSDALDHATGLAHAALAVPESMRGVAQAVRETCIDCGKIHPCDSDCPNFDDTPELTELYANSRPVQDAGKGEAVAWIAFAANGNIRFWTSDPYRSQREKERGLDLRAFTMAELIALVSRQPAPQPASNAGTIDRDELIKFLEDLASVNLTRDAVERQARRMADALLAKGISGIAYTASKCDCNPPLGSLCARCAAEAKSYCIHGVSLDTPCGTCETDYGDDRAVVVTSTHSQSGAK